MDKKASINEVTITLFSITLAFIMIAWQMGSFLLYFLALASLSINIFMEAYKERKKGNVFFFSQHLIRGVSLWVIIIVGFLLI